MAHEMLDALEQAVNNAELSVAVWGDPDITNIEFLPLRPRTLPQEAFREALAGWRAEGRSLNFVGTAALIRGHAVVTTESEPLDAKTAVSLLAAFTAYCEALKSGCSGEWCDKLYALPDLREAD